MQEYVRSVFDREFHYMDQTLPKDTLSAHETKFRLEISDHLSNLTPENAFERVKSKRDHFIAHSYNQCECPFVLRHGDLHRRNIGTFGIFSKLVLPDKLTFSHSSPRRILAILDWDFGHDSRSLIKVSRCVGQTSTIMLLCV